jgi:hypothetical protein
VSIKLHLGVADIPYGSAYQAATSRRPGPRPGPAQQIAMNRTTTGDVAQILERRYHIMEKYAELRADFIREQVLEAMHDKLERLHMGRGSAGGPLLEPSDLGAIQQDFQRMLDIRAFDNLIHGVPTAAAEAGVNHRLKRPYARSNPARPSFIDTGLYQANFRVWSD